MSFLDSVKLGEVSEREKNARNDKPCAGVHRVALVSAGEFPTKDFGSAAKLTWVVLSSTNPQVIVGTRWEEVYFVMHPLIKEKDRNQERLRQIVRVLIDADITDKAAIDSATPGIWSAAQTARGVAVQCTGATKISKKGAEYVQTLYEVLAQTDAEIAALRKKIDRGEIGVGASATPKTDETHAPSILSRRG